MGRTLLHVCCGPCASACVPRLKASGRDMTLLFANSNIDTREEFDRRLAAAKRLASEEGVPIRTIPYDHDEWLREVAAGHEHDPEKGERCARCFRYNLAKAAQFARAHGFDDFTTSLTVSPWVNPSLRAVFNPSMFPFASLAAMATSACCFFVSAMFCPFVCSVIIMSAASMIVIFFIISPFSRS